MFRTLRLLAVFCVTSFYVNAETDRELVINLAAKPIILQTHPELRTKINAAWSSIGYQVNWHVLPTERSLRDAASGLIDGEVGRLSYEVSNFTSLIPIPVPEDRIDIWVFVPTDKPCFGIDEIQMKRPVGAVGYRYFKHFYDLSVVGFEEVRLAEQGAFMLRDGRADYSAATTRGLMYLTKKTGIEFKTCFELPYISIDRYTFIHEKYINLLPEITKAYQQVFGTD